ncbi:MAG: hypothetical protein EOP54_18960, partial [Sphingobacteriales bacterium]
YAGTSFQKWKITKVAANYFTLMNLGSGLYAQSYNNNGTEVLVQNKASGDDSQMWNLMIVGGGKSYKAVNKASGLAITANGTGMVLLKAYTGAAAQLWGYNQLPSADTAKAAKFNVASILQSNMVIQRDKPFNVWGKATPNFTVSVKASWNPGLFTAVSDASGNWIVAIPAAPANAVPQTLSASVNGQIPVKLSNLLIGDVWVCSGQSNMEMTVDSTSSGFFYSGITNYKAEIAAANFPLIRQVNIRVSRQVAAQDTLRYAPNWTVCSPATVGPYSAVAYFFARTVHLGANVPVGIVVSCFGGSAAQQWTSKETIQNDPVLAGYYKAGSNSNLYNGMISPLRNLSIKGFTWYQGESNRDDTPLTNYTRLTSAMIGNWRALFNQGQLPFYYTQVTPYARDFFSTSPWGGNAVLNDYAYFREAQAAIKAVTPNTGQAITMDVGDLVRIHPFNKRPIGERLGLLALKSTYGVSVQAAGPQYASWTASGSKATISFAAGTATGLNTIKNAPLKQFFFAAGSDRVFRQATAVLSGNQVIVTASADTPLPIQAVRYAFTNFPITNLQNASGLPMEPFRTDDWTN